MDYKLRMTAKLFSDEEILCDLRESAQKIGKPTMQQREYLKVGKFSCKPFINRFGSWNNAIRKAGLETTKDVSVSDKELFQNLENTWVSLNRQPFYSEMKRPLSRYGVKMYINRFGGWIEALKIFLQYKESDIEFIKLLKPKSESRSRTINEKTRLRIYKRDNYACVICGRSPANQHGVILHLDHKQPFSKGGENSYENLRTLCDKCNLGRGADECL